jgi:multicomponent Na+:H+ antiporter subunit E
MYRPLQNFTFTFAFSLVFWLLLAGSLDRQELAAGLLVATAVAVLAAGRHPIMAGIRLTPKAPLAFVLYLAWLARALVLANLDMARRVLSPSLPIRPALVHIPTSLRSELGRLALANSITLTPGTLTVDVEDDEDIGRCASEVLSLLGQNNNIAIAAHFGRELAGGAKTLADLVSVAACVCGEYVPTMERDDYLRLRKRTLRIVDALSLGGVGLPVYEHKLTNGQIAYSLLSPDCYEGEPS